MQTDKTQIWQNAKGQITNVTKYKTTYYNYDKIQKDKMQKDSKQMWQNNKNNKTQIANTKNYN